MGGRPESAYPIRCVRTWLACAHGTWMRVVHERATRGQVQAKNYLARDFPVQLWGKEA